jgi:FkbM family methyltransferase
MIVVEFNTPDDPSPAQNWPEISFPWEGKMVRFAVGNPQDLIHRHLIAGRFFEAEELTWLRKIVPPQSTILEVGANIGNHLVYYGLFMQPKRILPIEPNPAAIALLKRNIELNQIGNVDMSLLGFGIGEKYGHFDLHVADNANIGAARLMPAHEGAIEVYPLDAKLQDKVDFIKIDVEWMEMEALRGAAQLIENSRPIIFIEIMNANIAAFHEWVSSQRYKIIKTFLYVNAKNFVAVPSNHPLASRADL